MPMESAVDPTRSANITVTWRRSAASSWLDREAAGTCERSCERRGVDLACRVFRKCARRLTSPRETAGAVDDVVQPQHLPRQTPRARPAQKALDPILVGAACFAKCMGEQKSPFAFPQISVDLFPVSRNVPAEV